MAAETSPGQMSDELRTKVRNLKAKDIGLTKENLGSEKDELSSLFFATHNVISELRKVDEKQVQKIAYSRLNHPR